MDIVEKGLLIDAILMSLYRTNIGTIPRLLNNSDLVDDALTKKYKVIEVDLIRFELVDILTNPGSNDVVGGFGEFILSAKGTDFVMNEQSALDLYI